MNRPEGDPPSPIFCNDKDGDNELMESVFSNLEDVIMVVALHDINLIHMVFLLFRHLHSTVSYYAL